MNSVPDSPAPPWVCAGGDGTRRGLFGGSAQLNFQVWRRLRLRGAGQSSVVFDAEDRAYVTDMAGQVQAFSSNAVPLWRTGLQGAISATPAVNPHAKRIYVGTHTGWLSALRTEDGRSVWQRRLPTQSDARILSDLLVVPGTDVVIVSSWGGQFHAIDGVSGQTRHIWDAGISPQSGVAALGQDHIYALRAVAGRGIEWLRLSLDGTERVLHLESEGERPAQRMIVAASPVLDPSRDRVYAVVNRNGHARLLAWSISNEQNLWQRELPAAVVATPTVGQDGLLWVADLRGEIHGIQPDGERRFSHATGAEYLLAGGVCEAGDDRFLLGDPLGQMHWLRSNGEGGLVYESNRSLQARPSFDPHGNLYLPGTDRIVRVFRNHAD